MRPIRLKNSQLVSYSNPWEVIKLTFNLCVHAVAQYNVP